MPQTHSRHVRPEFAGRWYGFVRGIAPEQWLVAVVAVSMLLKLVFVFLGLFDLKLGVVLGLNVLLSSLSVFSLYRVSERVTRSHWLALAIAVLYAFTYHCFYFNAFVLSENFAVPLVIAALYYLLLYTHRYGDAGIRAMYVPITEGRYGKYFLGQDSPLVTFLKPDSAQ